MRAMFSHIVVFWTNPAYLGAADDLLAGANQLLKDIPGVLQFHAGKMVPSQRLGGRTELPGRVEPHFRRTRQAEQDDIRRIRGTPSSLRNT